jgi:hypothetical protein
MTLTENQNTLVITDAVIADYSNVYIIQKITPSVADPENITYLVSEDGGTIAITLDGYYNVHRLQITTTAGAGYYILGDVLYGPGDVVIQGADVYLLLDIADFAAEGIIYSVADYFTYYNIEKYYVDFLKTKFLKNVCCCNPPNDRSIIDPLTMGIDVIKYLLEYQQYNEAARIVEMLATCTGVINTSCGCNG